MSGKTTDAILARLARHQHGLVTLGQAQDRGATEDELRARLARGWLRRAGPGVYAIAASKVTWEQRVLVACLAAGPTAVASHRSAALLWGLIDAPAPVELLVPYDCSPKPRGSIVHRTQDLRDIDTARRQNIPLTNPIRTMGDLGSVAPGLMPSAIERGLYRNLFSVAGLRRFIDQRGGPGRRGTGVLRRALERRALGDSRARSPLEPMFAAIAADAGLAFEYQHEVIVDGHRYVVDFALPDIRVGIEIDGLEVHATRGALDHDLERQNRLIGGGWLVLRYTKTHLASGRQAIQRELRSIIQQRRGHAMPA